MQQNIFTHPTKLQAIVISLIGGTSLLLLLFNGTNFFTEKFDPGLLLGGLMVGNFWIIARVWANYYRHKGED